MSEDDALDARGLIAHSYSTFFKVRKRMRKIQDLQLPFRRGVGIEQVMTFLLVLVLLLIIYATFLMSLFSVLGWSPPWQFYVLYFFGPPLLAGSRIGRPMKSGKTIFGTVRSYLRKLLDDPVHRRGMPLRNRPQTRLTAHFMRVWQADPTFERYLPSGATYQDRPTSHQVDLDDWIQRTISERLMGKDRGKSSAAEDDAWRRRMRGTTSQVMLPDEDTGDDGVSDDEIPEGFVP